MATSTDRAARVSVSSISSISSPVLDRSAFAQFDHFLSSSPRPAPSPPSNPSTSVRRARSVMDRSQPTIVHLNSPTEQSPQAVSPVGARHTARRSVQFGDQGINWARPLRQEPTVRIFGASMQRSRRLNRSMQSLSTPSPSTSSDEEPITPPATLISKSWSLPPLNEVEPKGLGFGDESEWHDEAYSGSSLADYLESSAASSSRGSPTPTQSRIISTSESLSELASPTTLQELRYLRQAASDLENEVKRSRTITHPPSSSTARRIKRKAVPSIDLVDSNTRPLSFCLDTPPPPKFHVTALPFPSRPTRASTPTGKRPFYQAHTAAQSVIEFSSRTFAAASGTTRMSSGASSSSLSSTRVSSSSASTESDSPLTPNSDRQAFIDQMESSLMMMSDLSIEGKKKKGISRFFKRT